MGIIQKIKSLLPISSRSVHAMYTEIYETILKQRADQAAFEGKTSLMLWELYRRDGETLEEAHHRLFENMSPATGSMRLYQLASAQLLHEFDALCKREGIVYWMVSGTLLGAVRHKGFIPWDDDLDVGMTRQDIEKLIAVLPEDGRYHVTVRFDHNALCRQVRFAYADETIPCFIDLLIFDPVARLGESTFSAREQAREELKQTLLADETLGYWNERDFYVDAKDLRSNRIAGYFDASVKALYDDGICTVALKDAEGIVWAIDNTDSSVPHHSWYLIPKTAIFPLCCLPFEGFELNAPADYNRCLSDIYGDIYQLPTDLASHFQHVRGDELADCEVERVLRKVIDSNC